MMVKTWRKLWKEGEIITQLMCFPWRIPEPEPPTGRAPMNPCVVVWFHVTFKDANGCREGKVTFEWRDLEGPEGATQCTRRLGISRYHHTK
jgi:hypothetical protein